MRDLRDLKWVFLLFLATATPALGAKVDFLWVIDNSLSMADEQNVLSAAADKIADRFARATCAVDWRLAVTYTDLYVPPSDNDVCPGAPGPGRRRVCPFTRSIADFRDGTPECAYVRSGTCGDGSERGFSSAADAIQRFLAGSGCEAVPGGECNLRPDARLAVVFFTDTGDGTPNSSSAPGQPDNSVASWADFFRDYDLLAPGGQRAQVHGLLCPFRPTPENPAPCSDAQAHASSFDRYSDLIRALGGTEASIRDDNQSRLTDAITQIVQTAIAEACCGNSVLEAGEECDDGNSNDGDCCSARCRIEPATAVCRPAAGACDMVEFCTGGDAPCPGDTLRPPQSPCRPATGTCDETEYCTGESTACPPDVLRPANLECRSADGPCDTPEACTGESPGCPVDRRVEGLEGMRCACRVGLAPRGCAGDAVPRGIARRFARACRLVERSALDHGVRGDRLLARALGLFDRAEGAAARAGRTSRIRPACATALATSLHEISGLMR